MLLRMALFFLNYPVRISQKSCRATNVEDIAAAFRKMAVINPERKKNITAAQPKDTAAEEQKAPAAKDSFGVRTAQAQVRQALYEGLLARTAEEQKKRKSKKAEVDENQLSIFGFAA